ncbi:MAG: sugar transferase, partial [Olsenella sp.]|nr:sugar transferase [Olsenella sp.]
MAVDDVFVCAPHASRRETASLVDAAAHLGASCHVALDLLDPTIQGATLGYFGELPAINYAGRGGWLYAHVLKRAFDILFSLVVVVLMVIPGAILCLVIALQSKGSPFYTQRRVGQGGRHFNLYKFRSMVADADNVEKYFTPEQLAEWERERKVEGDPRITAVGRILRKTSLDEFPQFLNVLKGDMSVVGPRPIVDDELVHYGDDLE